jgi:PAS domain S-box-containing protein
MSTVNSLAQTRRQYLSGEVIFREGDIGSTMLTIISGSVEVIKDGVVIARRGAGETIGEMALVESTPRFATVVASGNCEIEECSQERFLDVVRDDPTFALGVMKILSHRLRESDSSRVAELEQSNYNLQVKNKELSLVNNFLEQLISQSPAGIVITNKQGEVKRANPAASRIFGVEISQSWNSLLTYFPTQNPIENLWNSLKPAWVGECKATIAGRHKTLYLSVSRLYSYDPESSYLLICEDISELIELNEQIIKLERFATEGEISAEIAHDIKNYLTILKGNFELMQFKFDDVFRQRHQNHIGAIERGFGEIESFVENLMGGRGDEGQLADVNLAEMIRIMLKFLAPQKRFHLIKMTTTVDPTFPRHLKLKEKQIQQVLLNLLINAADALNDYQSGHSKEIQITLRNDAATSRPLLLIADNGPGIPPDRLEGMFNNRFTTKERGHGIGLITVKKIVDQHSASITVDSTLGQGTVFTIAFPGRG